MFVHGFGAADGEEFDTPPMPVTPGELIPFATAGLERVEYSEQPTRPSDPPHVVGRAVSFTAVYQRPPLRSNRSPVGERRHSGEPIEPVALTVGIGAKLLQQRRLGYRRIGQHRQEPAHRT